VIRSLGGQERPRGAQLISVALAVARKDLRSEWRTRELVPALGQFVVLALVIANFGFQIDSGNAATIAPGVLWLALVFAGLVAFGRAFAAEREQASLEAMMMTPAPAAAIFAGKALAAGLLLVVCEAVLLPALALFFGTPLNWALVLAVLLSTVGMAALGCLFAAMVARVRAREVLLPLLTLPLWIPFIVAGGRAVQVAMGASGSYSQAIALLVDFDILFVVLTTLAARFVLDD
jgi:heme exporter protein B